MNPTLSNAHDGAMMTPVKTEMETHTGKFVDVLQPDPRTIDIEDVAHHLAVTCRYGGAVHGFYSVAAHSVLVHDLLVHQKKEAAICLGGLLHDAAEAYLGDMVAPLKYAMRLQEYYDRAQVNAEDPTLDEFAGTYGVLSEKMDRAIGLAFSVDPELFDHPDVKVADMWALRIEAERLTKSGGEHWRWPGELPEDGKLPENVAFTDRMWSAKRRFISRFRDYFPMAS